MRFLRLITLGFCFVIVAESMDASSPRNVVFFLVDDLGWADLGCYGSTFHQTPNIDSLAESGMQFTQAYAAGSVCSPTRASIMTGRHPVRVGITDWIPGMPASRISDRRFAHVNDRDHLPLTEITIAEYLVEHGNYQTFYFGKWHLGAKGHWPTDQGFDINIGGCEKGSPPGGYYAPWKNPNLSANHDGEYLTERLTDEAVKRIEDADPTRPFLMFFSYYNVHTPIQPDRRTVARFRERARERFSDPSPSQPERDAVSRRRQDNPEYASMVAAVDTSVGRVLSAVESAGIADDTIVIFTSDNGGLCTLPPQSGNRLAPTSNLPLRSGKGWLYEGGIRVPLLVRAPGITEPSRTCDAAVYSADFFPTIIDLVGLPLAPHLHTDGISLRASLAGKESQQRSLFWHYPHYHGSMWKPGAAVRDGDWKLIEFYETEEIELYDLAADTGEQNDLSEQLPEVTARLHAKLHRWQETMNASMPQPRVQQR